MSEARKYRYGAFIKDAQARHTQISYNDLTALTEQQPSDRRITLRPLDIYRLLQPSVSVRFLEQFYAVFPLAAYLVLFELLILRQDVDDGRTIV